MNKEQLSAALESLLSDASMDAFRATMNDARTHELGAEQYDPDIYGQLFSSELGVAVLTDMVSRYVVPTRWLPGEGPESGYYREGMARVVHDILHRINQGRTD